MGRKSSSRKRQEPLRQLLGMAVSLLGIAACLFMASVAFGSSRNLALQAMGKGLKLPIPYVFVLGLVLLAVYFIIRNKAAPPTLPRQEPILFGQSTTRFAGPDNDAPIVRVNAPARLTSARNRTRATEWSDAVFDAIEWRRFEALCESLFSQGGFETKSLSHGADGGVDIWLFSRNAEGPAAVVQCKHWRGKRQVGVKEMREFFGVMSAQKVKRGTYATSSTYTDDAARFAKENGISALDGAALLALIRTRTPEQQSHLLEVAQDGEYWRPTCASCGIKMVEREPKKGGTTFWGCAQYPKCKFTLPMRAA